MGKLGYTQIYERLDMLVQRMNGRTLTCKSWHFDGDKSFTPDQIHGTFDLMIIGGRACEAMHFANDLWIEANK